MECEGLLENNPIEALRGYIPKRNLRLDEQSYMNQLYIAYAVNICEISLKETY